MVVTRDRAKVVPVAIESARNQDYAAKEIQIMDDASCDATAEVARLFPDVIYRRSETRLGCIASRNCCMRETTVDAVCLLDDDAWFLCDDALTRAMECIRETPRVAAVAFDVISPGREGRRPRGATWPAHSFQGCGCVLRMDAIRKVGGFPEGPGDYGSEEKDLALRLLDGGYEIRFLPGVHVWHEREASARPYGAQHASGVCNDMAWVLRRFPMPMVLWWLPAKALGNLRFSVRHGLFDSAVLGLLQFAKSIPRLLRERQPVRRGTVLEFSRRARRFPAAMAAGFPEGGADQEYGTP